MHTPHQIRKTIQERGGSMVTSSTIRKWADANLEVIQGSYSDEQAEQIIAHFVSQSQPKETANIPSGDEAEAGMLAAIEGAQESLSGALALVSQVEDAVFSQADQEAQRFAERLDNISGRVEKFFAYRVGQHYQALQAKRQSGGFLQSVVDRALPGSTGHPIALGMGVSAE